MNVHVNQRNIEPATRRVQRMLDGNDGDKAKTIKELIALAETQRTMRDTLIRLGAASLVGSLICKERAALKRGVEPERVQFTGAGTAVAPPVMSFRHAEMRRAVARNNVVRGWLTTYRLPTKGNKYLGVANERDVGEAVVHLRRQSGSMLHDAAWLDAIRAKLPHGKTVAEVLDDGTLDALYNSVSA